MTTVILGYARPTLTGLHYDVCDFIEEGSEKAAAGEEWHGLLLLPREHFKTTFSMARALQFIAQDPNKCQLILSAVNKQAKATTAVLKATIENNAIFQKLYPYVVPDRRQWRGDEFNVMPYKMSLGERATRRDPTVMSVGLGGTSESFHFDRIAVDDPSTKKNSESRTLANKVIAGYQLAQPLLNRGGEELITATRFADYDVVGWIEGAENETTVEVFQRKAVIEEELDAAGNETGKRIFIFPDEWNEERLRQKKANMQVKAFYCSPAGSSVLMADFSTKPIEDVAVGDSVLGFERKGREKGKYVSSKVVARGQRQAFVQKIDLQSGNAVYCTPDHRWYTGYYNAKGKAAYSQAGTKSPKLRSLIPGPEPIEAIPEEHIPIAMWLGGMFDGEGSLHSTGVSISQSEEHNPDVVARIRLALRTLGFEWSEYVVDKNKRETLSFYIKGGGRDITKFLQWCKPARIKQLLEHLQKHPPLIAGQSQKDKIEAIDITGYEDVYSIQTETGNYIASGYLSANCQYHNKTMPDELMQFKEEFFTYYDELPDNICYYIGWDPSPGMGGDKPAIIAGGLDVDGNIYISHAITKMMREQQQIVTIAELNAELRPVTTYMEAYGFAKSVIANVEDYQEDTGIYWRIDGLSSSKQSKESRVIGLLQPMYEKGKIKHHKTLKGSELEYQLMHFGVAIADDLPDALYCMVMASLDNGYWGPKELANADPRTPEEKLLAGKDLSAEERLVFAPTVATEDAYSRLREGNDGW